MSDGGNPSGEDVFDVDRIRRLVELMEQHELSQIDLRQGDERIRLSRGGAAPTLVSVPAPPPPAAAAPPAAAPPAAPASPPASGAEAGAAPEGAHIVTINSPMVGTFYGKPNPEAEPFVKVGSTVEPDTTVCVIEAMKVFNEIPAEVRGKVVAVLVGNEEPVDFGKPLFKIDTSA